MKTAQQASEERNPTEAGKLNFASQYNAKQIELQNEFTAGAKWQQRQGWIKVEHEMPKKGVRCLVFGEKIGVASTICHVLHHGEWVETQTLERKPWMKYITQWQPVPLPPENN